MNFTSPIFYFCFYSSIVLVYGIGIHQNMEKSKTLDASIFFEMIITFAVIILSTLICKICATKIFLPLNISNITPLFCLMVILPLTSLINVFKSLNKYICCAELSVTIPCVILAVTESMSLKSSLMLCVCFVCSYYLLIPVVYAIRQRLATSRPVQDFYSESLVFISIAVILCAIFACDVSWLNFLRLSK